RRSTNTNLEKVKQDLNDQTGTLETDETIWNLIRRKPICPLIQQFLYKSLHSTHKIGKYWLNIPECEDRCYCRSCGETKLMDHILTSCENQTRTRIWESAKELWPYGLDTWPEPSLGTIIGCNSLSVETLQKVKTRNGRTQEIKRYDPGATRLLRIIISESAYLIWTLRCNRTIRDKTYTEREIEQTWLRAINRRLSEDRMTATKLLKKPYYINIVKNTWNQALSKRHRDLPEDWINRNVV
ncbi:hypothetical protein EDB89DRAFT_1812507, partial [Lactarius sanguifluus]